MNAYTQAMNLYAPIVGSVVSPTGQFGPGTDPASSVTTYIVGYGDSTTPTLMNQIAWGGSGMTSGWNAAARLLCETCQDAFIAPDPASLASVLQSIFDQGAQSGEFTAQQSITGSIYEYVDQAPTTAPAKPFDARNPDTRYGAFTPVKFSLDLHPAGFQRPDQGVRQRLQHRAGHRHLSGRRRVLRRGHGRPVHGGRHVGHALERGRQAPEQRHDPHDERRGLPDRLEPGGGRAASAASTSFMRGATDANIGTSAAAIRRRIYTTSQNGYFGVTIAEPPRGRRALPDLPVAAPGDSARGGPGLSGPRSLRRRHGPAAR